MGLIDDQQFVETFMAHGSDPSLREGIDIGSAIRRLDHGDAR